MEVQVCGVDGLPGDGIISIKAGSSRRQAQVSQLGPGSPALNFPVSASDEDVKLKIDVMRSLGSQSMALRPEEGTYEVKMGESENISLKLGVRGVVSQKPQRNLMKAEDLGASPWHDRDYLEDAGVLKLMKTLLATVVLEQPEDPYSFMADQFSKVRFSTADRTNELHAENKESLPTLPAKIQDGTLEMAEVNKPSKGSSPTFPAKIQVDVFESAEAPIMEKAIPSRAVKEERHSSTIGEQSTGIPHAVKTLADLSLSGELANNLVAISSTSSEQSTGIQHAMKTSVDLSLSGGLVGNLAALPPTGRSVEIETTLCSTLSTTGQLANTLRNGRPKNIQAALSTLASLSISGELVSYLGRVGGLAQGANDIQASINNLAALSASGELASTLASSAQVDWPENIQTALSTLATLSTSGELARQLSIGSHTDAHGDMQTTLSTLSALGDSANLISTLATSLQTERTEHVQNALCRLAVLSSSGDLKNVLARNSQSEEVDFALQTVATLTESLSSSPPQSSWPENVKTALGTLASLSVAGSLDRHVLCRNNETATNPQADLSTTGKITLSTLSALTLSGDLASVLAKEQVTTISSDENDEIANNGSTQPQRSENVEAVLRALSAYSLSGDLPSMITSREQLDDRDWVLESSEQPPQAKLQNVADADVDLKESSPQENSPASKGRILDDFPVGITLTSREEGLKGRTLDEFLVEKPSQSREEASNGRIMDELLVGILPFSQYYNNYILRSVPCCFPFENDEFRLRAEIKNTTEEATCGESFRASLEKAKATHQAEQELVGLIPKRPYQHLPSAGASYSRRLPSSFAPAPLPKGIGIGNAETLKGSLVPSPSTADSKTLMRPDIVKKAGAVEALLQHEDAAVRDAVREALMAAGIDQSQLP